MFVGKWSASRPAPANTVGAVHWIRVNLFSSWFNTLLTILVAYFIYVVVPPLIQFAFVDSVWSGVNREACSTLAQGGVQPDGWLRRLLGLCRGILQPVHLRPLPGRRTVAGVNIVFLMFFGGLTPLLIPAAPFKSPNIVFIATDLPGRFVHSPVRRQSPLHRLHPAGLRHGAFGRAVLDRLRDLHPGVDGDRLWRRTRDRIGSGADAQGSAGLHGRAGNRVCTCRRQFRSAGRSHGPLGRSAGNAGHRSHRHRGVAADRHCIGFGTPLTNADRPGCFR